MKMNEEKANKKEKKIGRTVGMRTRKAEKKVTARQEKDENSDEIRYCRENGYQDENDEMRQNGIKNTKTGPKIKVENMLNTHIERPDDKRYQRYNVSTSNNSTNGCLRKRGTKRKKKEDNFNSLGQKIPNTIPCCTEK